MVPKLCFANKKLRPSSKEPDTAKCLSGAVGLRILRAFAMGEEDAAC